MKLGVPVLLVLGILGCGGSSSGGNTYPLPGATQIDIPAGGCIIVNAAPQSLPPSTVAYSLDDGGGTYADSYEVGVVPSSYTCQFPTADAFIDDVFIGSASDVGSVPSGIYDLDIICQNASADCLINSVTWSATY
ncbi:MAG TPA: hypothetical protein VKU44_09855 [Terriglobia bacterium]|nr:hypothetical protein [Terriglobia bacterium]